MPLTLDRKRVWDEVDDEPENGGLYLSYNVEALKRRKLAEEQGLKGEGLQAQDKDQSGSGDEDNDSMLDVDSEDEDTDSVLEDGDSGDEDVQLPDAKEAPEDPLPSKAQLKSSNITEEARATSPTLHLPISPSRQQPLRPNFPPFFSSRTMLPSLQKSS